MLGAIDHVGIAVPDLEQALPVWAGLGPTPKLIEEVPEQGVRVALLPVGDGKVELLAPLAPDTPVGRFLARRGPGVHHVAFAVDNIHAALAAAAAGGYRLIDEVPRKGAGGALIAFLHPQTTGGTLLELCQR